MYSNDAKQRVSDNELLLRCGKWLIEEDRKLLQILASDRYSLRRHLLVGRKHGGELGVVLPTLTSKASCVGLRPQRGFDFGGLRGFVMITEEMTATLSNSRFLNTSKL